VLLGIQDIITFATFGDDRLRGLGVANFEIQVKSPPPPPVKPPSLRHPLLIYPAAVKRTLGQMPAAVKRPLSVNDSVLKVLSNHLK